MKLQVMLNIFFSILSHILGQNLSSEASKGRAPEVFDTHDDSQLSNVGNYLLVGSCYASHLMKLWRMNSFHLHLIQCCGIELENLHKNSKNCKNRETTHYTFRTCKTYIAHKNLKNNQNLMKPWQMKSVKLPLIQCRSIELEKLHGNLKKR